MADNTYERNYRSPPPGGRDAGGEPADPLTELARLIGQSDPFAMDPRGVPPRDQRAEPDWRQAAYDERPVEPSPRYARGDSSYDRDAGQFDFGGRGPHGGSPPYQGDQFYQSHAPAPPYHRDEHTGGRPPFVSPAPGYDRYADYDERGRDTGDQPYDDRDEREPPTRRGRLAMTAAAIVGVALIGTAGAFAYRAIFKSSSGAPPVIRAVDAPNKIVPSTPGGDAGKSFADRLGPDRGQNERVVPREEQPLDLSRAIASAQASAPAPAAPQAAAAATEPRKIRTIPIRSDQGGDMRPQAAPPRPAAPSTRAVAPAPTSGGPLSLSPQAPSEPPRPQAQVRTAAVPPTPIAPPAPAASAGGDGYYVQISAQKSEAEAQAAFRVAQAKYASVLGSHRVVVRRKDLGAKGVFYGAQVGPFGKDEAARLCDSLKVAGGSCMIQRN